MKLLFQLLLVLINLINLIFINIEVLLTSFNVSKLVSLQLECAHL